MARPRKETAETASPKPPTPRRRRGRGIMYASSYEAAITKGLRDLARAEAAGDPSERIEFRVRLTRAQAAAVRVHVERLAKAGMGESFEGWIRDVVLCAVREGWIRRPGSVLVDGSLAPHGGLRGRE